MSSENSPKSSEVPFSQWTEAAQKLRETMHALIESRISNLEDNKIEERLHNMVTILLNDKWSLNFVFTPPPGNNLESQQQWSAFLTWIFGALFKLMNSRLNNDTVLEINTCQSTILRILSRLNLNGHDLIAKRYMKILKDLSEFKIIQGPGTGLEVSAFNVENNIEGLNLKSYPVIIKADRIKYVQILILQMILQSEISVWNSNILWETIIKVLETSDFEVRDYALAILIEIFQLRPPFSTEREYMEDAVMSYSEEIISILPSLDIPCETVTNYIRLFKNLIEVLTNRSNTYIFCLSVIDSISSGNFKSPQLMQAVCSKMKIYLSEHKSSYDPRYIKQYINYCRICPEFVEVLIYYIYFDVTAAASQDSAVTVSSASKLWIPLKELIISSIVMEKLNTSLLYFKAIKLLNFWLKDCGVRAAFFETDSLCFVDTLIENIRSNSSDLADLIFEHFIEMLHIDDLSRHNIHDIIILSWVDDQRKPIKDNRLVVLAEGLSINVKVKCLRALLTSPYAKQYLHLLRTCTNHEDENVVIAGILCCPWILFQGIASFDEIIKLCIQPLFERKSPKINEAIASVLGDFVCLASKCGKFVRKSSDSADMIVECRYCDEYKCSDNFFENILPRSVETLILPLFQLMKSESKQVRLLLSQNLHKYSNHTLVFNNNDITKMWLEYIEDKDENIRVNVANRIGIILQNKMNMMQVNEIILENNIPKELDEFIDLVLNKLLDTLFEVFNTSNNSVHETMLMTAKNLVWIPLHLTERRVLTMFLHTILHPVSSYSAIDFAATAFKEVAKKLHDISPENMFIRYQTDFIELIVFMTVHNFLSYSYNLATSLHRTTKCLGYQGSRQFIEQNRKYFVCHLIPHIAREPKALDIIKDLENSVVNNISNIINESFGLIYMHVNLNEPPEVTTKCLQLIVNLTGEEINRLIVPSIKKGILFHFILRLNEHKEKVIEFLRLIFELNGYQRRSENTEEFVVKNIEKFFLHPILLNLDKSLRLKYDEYVQKSALASLVTFINLMGAKHIKKFRYMILIMLRTALGLKWPGFKKLCCDAFNAYIRNIAIEDLGPLLPTICISMVSLLECCPRESNRVFKFLIIENEEGLSPYIPELFFVNDLQISNDIADVIKSHIQRAKPRSIGKNLEIWLKRIKHEIEEIRLKAFVQLQIFLASHRNEINELIVGDTIVHPLIVQLLDALLTGCQDKKETIRLTSAECIGELGAVEPRLLPRRILTTSDSIFISAINNQFACAALEELIRSLQTVKGTESNIFSFAIQEILKTFHISPNEQNSEWHSFSPTMQQIITPFLTSRYTSRASMEETDYPHPIYGSEMGSTYESWTYNWLCSMSKNVQDPTYRHMLSNCKLAFTHDIKIAIFFLPHIVVHIIAQRSKEHCDKLLEEILVVIKNNDNATIEQKILPIKSELNLNSNRESDETRRVRCSQVIFYVLDHISRWLIEQRLKVDEKYKAVQDFRNKIDFLLLAKAAYLSSEYHRALLYLEHDMISNNKQTFESIEGALLSKIYSQLDEPDGIAGILAALNHHPTIQQQTLCHEIAGKLQDAASCYDILVKNVTPNTKYLKGMIQCYINLNQPFTAMSIAEGVLQYRPELEPLINEHEPFWKLAHYGMLDNLSRKNIKNTILNDLKNGIKPDLISVKKELISLLRSPSHPGAYQESYSCVMKLHTLHEFEEAITIMLDNVENVPKIFEKWEKRGQLVRATRGQEFLLSMRRMTLDLALKLYVEKKGSVNSILKEEIGKLWLKSARIARKAGSYQQAYGYILSASNSCVIEDMYIEQAQLYWDKGSQDEAITTLKRCLSSCFKSTSFYQSLSSQESVEERKKCAKAKLYYAKYNDKTVSVQVSSNIKNYEESLSVWGNWEKSCVAFAEYYESIVEKLNVKDRDLNGREFQEHMITYYGKSLQYGCKYIHQSMPRMLTAWIDYASRLKADKSLEVPRVTTLSKMTRNIEIYVQRLPAFMWFTAFSQIVSRIGHPANEVRRTLSNILVKVIHSYPQQSLWMMASICNTSYTMVKNICQTILNDQKLRSILNLIRDFDKLWQNLIELCSKEIRSSSTIVKVRDIAPKLPRLLSSPGFSAIMMPTTNFLQIRLPVKGDSLMQHNPFPATWHQITGISEEATVLHSLLKPRKITFKGSDGKSYPFLCKFRDDLRKDFRFIEFDYIVNKCLQKNPESCQKRLYVRTYSVIPLNELCGLIEWVPNLIGLRPIISKLCKEKGHVMLKHYKLEKDDPLDKKRKVFREEYLPSCPPVFGDWFRINFPDVYGWYEARAAYIRTTAVMSMVGYIMGLGDRHGENINLDSKNGDCVHIDLSCLFNRGELLPWPERVPFRLTHNMIHAMGPLKLEGPFRKTCETTLRVLRENSRTLISVLIPFVYDPMVKWSKKHRTDSEMTNDNALNDIKKIEQRLKGMISSQLNVPLNFSVEGQTNYLILEATNIDNLCQMFFGWGAFI